MKPKVPKLQCPQCPKSFTNERGLSIHTSKSHPQVKSVATSSIYVETGGSVNSKTKPLSTSCGNAGNTQNVGNSWGNFSLADFEKNLDAVYDKIVYMRQNLFKVPTGSPGKDYIKEITRLVTAWKHSMEMHHGYACSPSSKTCSNI